MLLFPELCLLPLSSSLLEVLQVPDAGAYILLDAGGKAIGCLDPRNVGVACRNLDHL